jgi:protein-tyrosine phosphatase
MKEAGTTLSLMRPRRRFGPGVIVVALVAIAVAAPIAWNNGLRDQFFPRNFGEVEPGKIYRSGQISARLVESTLAQYHIQSIVALADTGMKPADREAEEEAAANLKIQRAVFPLSGDGTGRLDEYAEAIAAIDRAVHEGKPVLVHCVAGAQRSGGVIAAYEVLVEKRSPQDAVAEMRRFGHDPRDNPHLLEYLNDHMGELAHRLVELGVIDQVPDPSPVVKAE